MKARTSRRRSSVSLLLSVCMSDLKAPWAVLLLALALQSSATNVGTLRVGSNLCWQSNHGNAFISVRPCNKSDTQQMWSLVSSKRITRVSTSSRLDYRIESLSHESCVTIAESSDAETGVSMLPCLDTESRQLFDLFDGQISSRVSGKCLMESSGQGRLIESACRMQHEPVIKRDDNVNGFSGSIKASNGQCLTRQADSTISSTECSSSDSQKFVIIPFGANVFVKSPDYDWCLEISGSDVVMNECSGDPVSAKSQQFTTANRKDDLTVSLQNAHSGLCLDILTDDIESQGRLKQWLCNDHATQLFTLAGEIMVWTTSTSTSTTTSTKTTTTSSTTSKTTSTSSTTSKTTTTSTSTRTTTTSTKTTTTSLTSTTSTSTTSTTQSTTTTTTTFSPTSTAVMPVDKMLIQSDVLMFGTYPACWEVGSQKNVVAAICDQSNINQWWSLSFAQLVHTDSSGTLTCAGASKSNLGAPITVTPCGISTSQSFFFHPDSKKIRVAQTYNCVSIKANNSIVVDTCSDSTESNQTFIASNPSLMFPPPIKSGCSSYTERKEWRDLKMEERQAFVSALQGVRKLPSTAGRRSYFDDLVAVHATLLDFIHGNPSFWPWHRHYMQLFEDALQKVDASVTLPYWDWGFDGSAPLKNTDIFGPGDTQFGTRGDSTKSYPTCLKDGLAKSWTSMFNQCASRNYSQDTVVYDDGYMMPLVLKTSDFESFAKAAEAAHNVIHFYIGGAQGDLYFIDLSTNDPLFFIHHANVDRYWNLWQKHHPNSAGSYSGSVMLPPGSQNRESLQLTDIMPGFNVPASTAMFSDAGNGYCIKYIPYSQSQQSIAASDMPPLSYPTSTVTTTGSVVPTPGQVSPKRRSKDAVPPIPDDWEMFSSFRSGEGYLYSEVGMMAMKEAMVRRIHEGEMELARVAADFDALLALAGDSGGIQARVDVIRGLIAELHATPPPLLE
ncbi:hypothetical protein CcCBS67573_g05839 [Chytriomyces confervae]|uniref:Tyrosinase copper-binding domain-containing protein n=1 Tax=Chytriomyces confervae TaxID=246404 RepID=A0A507F875_9FUNG|nr:hypothetical protein CcCBS67573_g05839 [Chytriomyces confervae]